MFYLTFLSAVWKKRRSKTFFFLRNFLVLLPCVFTCFAFWREFLYLNLNVFPYFFSVHFVPWYGSYMKKSVFARRYINLVLVIFCVFLHNFSVLLPGGFICFVFWRESLYLNKSVFLYNFSVQFVPWYVTYIYKSVFGKLYINLIRVFFRRGRWFLPRKGGAHEKNLLSEFLYLN